MGYEWMWLIWWYSWGFFLRWITSHNQKLDDIYHDIHILGEGHPFSSALWKTHDTAILGWMNIPHIAPWWTCGKSLSKLFKWSPPLKTISLCILEMNRSKTKPRFPRQYFNVFQYEGGEVSRCFRILRLWNEWDTSAWWSYVGKPWGSILVARPIFSIRLASDDAWDLLKIWDTRGLDTRNGIDMDRTWGIWEYLCI